jgi:hypothetical protein
MQDARTIASCPWTAGEGHPVETVLLGGGYEVAQALHIGSCLERRDRGLGNESDSHGILLHGPIQPKPDRH